MKHRINMTDSKQVADERRSARAPGNMRYVITSKPKNFDGPSQLVSHVVLLHQPHLALESIFVDISVGAKSNE